MRVKKTGNKKFLKQLMSSLLALLMVLGLIPASIVPAVAAETAPNEIYLKGIDTEAGSSLHGKDYDSDIFGDTNLHCIQVNAGADAYEWAFCLDHGLAMRNAFKSTPFNLKREITGELSDVSRIILNAFYSERDKGTAVQASALFLPQVVLWMDQNMHLFNGMQVFDYTTPETDSAGHEHSYTINKTIVEMIAKEYHPIFQEAQGVTVPYDEVVMLVTSLLRSGESVTGEGWIPLDSYRYFRYEYSNASAGAQDLLVAMPLDEYTDNFAWIKIGKADEHNSPLSGAQFAFYADEGCTVQLGAMTSENDGWAYGQIPFPDDVSELTVWVKEIQAPPGYEIGDEAANKYSVTVTLGANATKADAKPVTSTPVKNVEKPDSPDIPGNPDIPGVPDTPDTEVVIEKLAAGTLNHLAGATFEVFVDAKKIGEFTTDGNGIVHLSYDQIKDGLDPDKKSWTIGVREIDAPEGYIIDDNSLHEVEFTEGTDRVSFVFTDTAETELIIRKRSADNNLWLEGAVFDVTVDGTKIGSYRTDENGTITINWEKYGYYVNKNDDRDSWTLLVEEVTPPSGYLKPDPSYQEIEVMRGMKVAEVTFVDTQYPEIVIIKRDTETGELLPNTTFRIMIDGVEFGTRTTNEAGEIRITYAEYGRFLDEKNMDNWTITVTEVEMPDLYNKDKQASSGDYTLTQQLKRGQSLTVFEFKDTSYRSIKVYKYDAEMNWPLAGATFRLHCVKADDLDAGNITDRELTTDGKGFVIFENVPNGTYELTEVNPPYGYNGTSEKKTVIVTSDNDPVIEFSFENTPMTGILLRKIDAVTKQPIPNVRFRVTPLAPLTGEAQEYTTNDNGVINIENVMAGSYKIEEIATVDGYVLNTEPKIIEVTDQHDSYTVTIENNQKNMLNILKLDGVTKQPLPGAMFSISTAGGTHVANVTTGMYGYASLPNLKPGSYVVKEIDSPMGYILDDTPQTFEVKDDDSGQVFTLIFCNNPYANLYIRKCDALTHVGIEGAVFRVTQGDGKIIADQVRTDETGFLHIGNLSAGTYQIQEIQAPAGYLLNDTVYTVYLNEGENKTIEIPNEKPGGIAVRKIDAKTGEPLAGAKFTLTEIDGTVISTQTTGKDGYARWEKLPEGWYILQETEAPDGYIRDTVSRNVYVKDFESTEVEWENDHYASLTITKRDKETSVGLKGATFEVRTLNGTVVATLTTESNGVATSGLLEPGWYNIYEIAAPDGYALNEEPLRVEILKGTPVSVDFFNEAEKGIIIRKIDGITEVPLSGATFELYTAGGNYIDSYVTDGSGTIMTPGLEAGIYRLVETRAPQGYVLNSDPITVEVKAGIASNVTVRNYPETSIQVYKTDSVTGDPLAYAEFEILDSKGNTIEVITTDKTGWAYSMTVQPGEYIVKESKAPNGYSLDSTEHRVTVVEGKNAVLKLTNAPDTVLHITKIDAVTKKPLAGAVFQLSGICGREPCVIIGQYTTDDHGQAVTEPLAPGVYELKELYAPDGYAVDETIHEVCIKAGEYNNVIIENQELATLIVRKIDSRTGKPIAGAVFKVENADRMDLVGTLETDANGEAIFTGLTEGFYIVTETQAPSGYTISESPKTIQVEYGKANYCDFKDAANGSLVVILQDKHTGEYLRGGQFVITRESDQIVIYDGSTDITGTITIGDLLPGWYYIKQVYAPDKYTMIDVDIHVEVKSGEQQTVYFKDETASIVIEKVDRDYPELMLEGARFQLKRDSDGIVIGEYVTGKDGLALADGLTPGIYTVTELVAPYGYEISEEPKKVEVKGGTAAHVTFMDEAISSISIQILTEGTRKPIAGATVEVWVQNGELVNTYTSDTTGLIQTDKIPEGYYVLKLVNVPDGYTAPTPAETTVELRNGIETTYTFELKARSSLKIMSVNNAGQAVAGMKVTVTKLDGSKVGDYVTGKDGSIVLDVEAGWYVVSETQAPDGYVIGTDREQRVEVNGTATVTFKHSQVYGLQILTTSQAGATVAGAGYEIRTLEGTLIGNYTSNAAGLVFVALEPGWYTVKPTTAPNGYTIADSTTRNIEVKADGLASTTFVLNQMSSIRIKMVDGTTKTGIYGVQLLLTKPDSTTQVLTTNNEGYITLDQSVLEGNYTIQIISAPAGYITDSMPRTISTLIAQTTEVTWALYKQGGQLQITVTSADYNKVLDKNAGSALQGAVFEVYNADTNQVVAQVISDAKGIATATLPIGRYIVKQVSSAAYYGASSETPEIRIKVNNDVVQTSFTNASVELGTSITVKSNTTVKAGTSMRVDISGAKNGSSTRLDNFYLHIKVPTDAALITTLSTGKWNLTVSYSISYKTNMNDYRTLASNLQSTNNYQYDLSTQALGLQAGEYVTDVRFEFGTVPAGFTMTTKAAYTQYVLATVHNGYKLISRVEIGGQHNAVNVSTTNVDNNNPYSTSGGVVLADGTVVGGTGTAVVSGNSGQWTTNSSMWTSTVSSSVKTPTTLPKTGY